MQRKRTAKRRTTLGRKFAIGCTGLVIVISLVIMSAQSLMPRAAPTPTLPATRKTSQRSAIQPAAARTPRLRSGTPFSPQLLATLISKMTPDATAPPQSAATATPVPSPTPLPVTTVPAVTVELADGYAAADIRSGPGTAFDVIGRLEKGRSLSATGQSQGAQWWRVVFDGQTGWLANQGVTVTGQASALPVVDKSAPQ